MALNEAQRRAWQALGLGPLWRLRASGDEAPGDAAGTVGTAETPEFAEPAEIEEAAHPVRPPTVSPRTPVSLAPQAGDADREDPADVAVGEPREGPGLAAATPDWAALRERVADCRRCGLCEGRTQTVLGVGPTRARLMVIGEAPGAEEDLRGEPFVGQAGRLLDNMLAAVGMSRERDVYIANVLKCRPPGNRNPLPEEIACCLPYLLRQIAWVGPEVILLVGRFAAQTILQREGSIASLRGAVHRVAIGGREVPAIVTYHPAYLLRSLGEKARAWRDLAHVRQLLGAAPAADRREG